LQALQIVGMPSLDTRNWDSQMVNVGETMNITWIDMDDVEAPMGD